MVDTPAPGYLPDRASREVFQISQSAVSWSAIIAGAVATAVLAFILLVLGSALGFSVVSPWSGEGMSVEGFAISTVIWLIITQWLSAGVGGYIAGRLRTKWVDIHSDEVFFRDTAHGFLAWGLALLMTVTLVASATTAVISGGTSAVSAVVSGGAHIAASSDDDLAKAKNYFTDMLFRPDRSVLRDDGRQDVSADQRAEALRILMTGLGDGEISSADREYLGQVVSAETGIKQQEAERRVDQVIAGLRDAESSARTALDEARATAAKLSLFTFLSLLIGAFIACVGAALGGHLRDDEYVQR